MNIYRFPDEKIKSEIIETILNSKNVRIEKIISDGNTSGWYDQKEDEWVVLLKGEAEIEFENSIKVLNAGDYIFIPKHKRHRVKRTAKCIWLCVFIGDENEVN